MLPPQSDPPPPRLSPKTLEEWKRCAPGQKSERYMTLTRANIDAPAPCIISSGSDHCAVHYAEPRRFSIPELRAICGFPADYVLRGSYADRSGRLGNAVPPLMMRAIAAELRDGLFARLGRTKKGFIDAMADDTAGGAKPAFSIPTMADVARSRGTAGLTVASTFSGCGGSCTGFEMAGYRVLWANEFLPIARESYAANHPHTILDGRDIRQVQAEEILEAIGLEPGELDVFNGSPPCQAFSSAGRRDKGWGTEREYANGVKQKNEELFFDFIRLLRGLRPRAFVAENVAGLVRGTAIGFFKMIMRELVASGYRVRCKVLDAQWLGVPQSRQRSIFIGVRDDLNEEPDFPKPKPYRYVLRDIMPSIEAIGHRGLGGWDDPRPPIDRGSVNEPVPTITCVNNHFVRDAIAPESRLPESSAAYQEWKRLKPGQHSTKYQNLFRTSLDEPSPCILSGAGAGGGSSAAVTVPHEPRRFSIDECRTICGFPADYILRGSYAEQWARLGNAVPPLMMREIAAALRDGVFTRLGRTRVAA